MKKIHQNIATSVGAEVAMFLLYATTNTVCSTTFQKCNKNFVKNY